jgi:MFS family permease
VLILIWFTLSFGSYGISTWISLLFFDVGITNIYASSFIFAIANLPGNYFSIQFMDKFGGRRLLFYGMCLSGISVLGFAFDTTQPVVVILSASLFNCFSVVGWNSLDCLSVEYFPTRVRTSAMGSLAAAGRLGAICAEFINGSLESNIPALLIVTSGCTILGGLAAWLLPEENPSREAALLLGGLNGSQMYEQLRTSSRASSRDSSPQSHDSAHSERRQMQMASLGLGVDGIDGSELGGDHDDMITS